MRDPVVAPLLVMTALLALSSVPSYPSAPSDGSPGWWDVVPAWLQNSLHVPAYAVLGLTMVRATDSRLRAASASTFWALAAALSFAVFDEWWQGRIPGRTASPIDAGLDAIGVIAGLLLYRITTARRASA